MKKRLFCFLLSLTLVALGALCIVSCGKDSSTSSLPKLKTPVLTKDNYTVKWEKVENAVKYQLDIDGEISFVDADTTSYYLPSNKLLKIRAIGDGVNYSASDWSESIYTWIETSEDEI